MGFQRAGARVQPLWGDEGGRRGQSLIHLPAETKPLLQAQPVLVTSRGDEMKALRACRMTDGGTVGLLHQLPVMD